MKYDEEIVTLQKRVDELEGLLSAAKPSAPASEKNQYTIDQLEALSDEEIGDLFAKGEIEPWQLGAAIAGKRVKGNLTTRIQELEAQVAKLPVETDPLQKSSGDDQNAGDWTKAGDGSQYPDATRDSNLQGAG
jgi:hypothetical protein